MGPGTGQAGKALKPALQGGPMAGPGGWKDDIHWAPRLCQHPAQQPPGASTLRQCQLAVSIAGRPLVKERGTHPSQSQRKGNAAVGGVGGVHTAEVKLNPRRPAELALDVAQGNPRSAIKQAHT